jgi:hypothetical protein
VRAKIFTERIRRLLEGWLEDGTTMQIFVDVRRNLNRVTNDVHLLTEVARRARLDR